MSIHIIEGVPGSGKTYYAVKHLLDNYFIKDAEGNFTPKKPIKIITNVEGFALPHENLNDAAGAIVGGITRFFSKDFQERIFEKHGAVIYMIDEAQMIFDRKFYDREVFSWFEYHRHYGQTIYLITQSALKLPKDITCLVETIIRALPRSRSITGMEFRYNLISGSHTRLSIQKIDKKIFDFYHSSGADEVEKVGNPFMKRIAVVAVLALLLFYFGWKYIFDTWTGSTSNEAQASIPPGQYVTSQKQSAINQPIPHPSPEKLIPHKLNYLALSAGPGSYVKIAFEGRIYTLQNFPYKVEMHGNELIAMIPEEAYLFHFPEGKPERKYYTPQPVEEPGRHARLERMEPGHLIQE